MMERLEPESIKIDYIQTAKFSDGLPNPMEILDPDELKVYGNYRRDEKKREFLLGRYLLKHVLALQLGVQPLQITLLKRLFGKLYIDQSQEAMGFNLAHTKGCIACALVLGGEIGIDLENMSRDLQAIGERFFHPQERAYLSQYECDTRNKMAYTIWTMKEAYVKYRGLELRNFLEGFNVLDCSEAVFHTFEPVPQYLMTVAVKASMRAYKVHIHEVLPTDFSTF